MNIWDSVQRGLEKATQEAARIAKAQRLRSTLEGVSKQIETQQRAIVVKTMDLFKSGQLTQNELFALCQDLSNFEQQFMQAQSELKQVQSQGTQSAQSNATSAFTQTSYQPYNSSMPSLIPPPPPGVELPTVSSQDTIRTEDPSAIEQAYCNACHTILVAGNVFCHNCGAPVNNDAFYQPTTAQANIDQASEIRRNDSLVLNAGEQESLYGDNANSSLQEKRRDGGI